MKTLAIIGARSGSKSVINKNLSEISEFNLLELVLKKAKQVNEISTVCCTSDSIEYLKISEYCQTDYSILRPNLISQDASTEYEYISHALESIDEKFDILVRLQATSPFQKRASISEMINKLIQNNELDSVQIVSETTPNVAKIMTINQNTECLERAVTWGNIAPTNRQGHIKSFFRSNAYAVRTESISKESLLGEKSGFVLGDPLEKFDIDSKLDLEICQLIAAANPDALDLMRVNEQ